MITMIESSHLNADERLSILRAADQIRGWSSVDDERCCVLCDRTFTGRQVEIGRRQNGRYDLHCPTPGCKSLPHQWVYPGNPLIRNRLSRLVVRAWRRTRIRHANAAGL